MITIKLEGAEQLQRSLDSIAKGLGGKAIAMALNKVAKSARTEADRGIREVYFIKQKGVMSRLRVTKAHKRKLQAMLSVTGRGRSMNAIHFMEKKVTVAQMRKRRKQGDRQLHFKFRKDRGDRVIKGAFIGNKGRTVFIRTGKARLPIKAVETVGIPSMFNSRKVRSRIIKRIKRDLPIEVGRAVNQVIRKHLGNA